MTRYISKVIQIGTSDSASKIETTLNLELQDGWQLISVFSIGLNTYAVLYKSVAK